MTNTWISGGLRGFIPVYRQVQQKGIGSDDFYSDVDISNAKFDAYRINQLLGMGIDFPTADGTVVRAGVLYDRGRGFINPVHAPFTTSGIQFLTAILF
jgi:hypothetical protein